jgi:hydrogenase expression/formation protein HypC
VSGLTAVVDYDGVQTSARLEALGEPVSPGDYVLVHAGFAIQRMSREDGEETLRLFDELAQSVAAAGCHSDSPHATEADSGSPRAQDGAGR